MFTFIVMVYMVITLLIAYIGGRGAGKSADSFLMADRSLSTPVYSLTYMATFTGGGLVTGLSTLAFTDGVSAQWLAFTQGMGFITIVFFFPYLRKFSSSMSVPEVIGKLYGKNSRQLTTVVTLLGCLALTAGQTIGMGSLISILTGLSLMQSFWISTFVFIIITIYGGLKSVAWADVFHGLTLALGILILVPVALYNAGGVRAITESTQITSVHINWFGVGLVQIFTWYLTFLFTCGGSQFLVQRVWAARTKKTAIVGNIIAGSFLLIFGIFPAIAGLLARSVGPADLDPRMAFAWVVTNLLPEFLGALLLAAAIAAIMSGADSFLLAASTTFINDIFIPMRGGREKCSDKEIVFWSRVSILVFGIFAALVSLTGVNIVPINLLGMGIMGGPIFIALLYSMWKDTIKKAIVPSIIIGGIVLLVWEYLTHRAFNIESAVPAAIATAISIFLISKFSKGDKVERVVETTEDIDIPV